MNFFFQSFKNFCFMRGKQTCVTAPQNRAFLFSLDQRINVTIGNDGLDPYLVRQVHRHYVLDNYRSPSMRNPFPSIKAYKRNPLTITYRRVTIIGKVVPNRYWLKKRATIILEETMKRLIFLAAIISWAVFSSVPTAEAHFQGVIPSDDMVSKSDTRTISIDLVFHHPFEG